MPFVLLVPFVALLVAMNIYLNGERREVRGTSIAELITELDLPVSRIAIELNREVVRRSDWSSAVLKDEDRIEIVHFVGGGVESNTYV